MMKQPSPLYACILIVCFSFSVLHPGDAWGFFDEDTLKTTGIIIGITFGVCLVVVLVAGTLKDLKGEPEDLLTELHLPALPQGWQDPHRFFGIVPERTPVVSPTPEIPFRYGTIIAREEQTQETPPGAPTLFRFAPDDALPGVLSEQVHRINPPG